MIPWWVYAGIGVVIGAALMWLYVTVASAIKKDERKAWRR